VKRPRYYMHMDLGDHGISTTEPRTWPTIRKYINEELAQVRDPEVVVITVSPRPISHLGGRRQL